MTGWLGVALWGGIVGSDSTSFPQVMVSRPLVAGAVTGLIFGRPLEGAVVGFLVEVFSLTTLPIGAARYPESGTATVAAAAAYSAVAPAGLDPGYLVLALAFALAWERLGSVTVVLQRRANGRMLIRATAMAAGKLERRHLAAMTLDFLRGAALCLLGGLSGALLIGLVGPLWGLDSGPTAALLAVLAAAMVGTSLPLFSGPVKNWLPVLAGAAAGILVAMALLP